MSIIAIVLIIVFSFYAVTVTSVAFYRIFFSNDPKLRTIGGTVASTVEPQTPGGKYGFRAALVILFFFAGAGLIYGLRELYRYITNNRRPGM